MLVGGGQVTPTGVSWPPPPIPSQKVENYFWPKTHETSVFLIMTTVLPVYDVFMVKTVYIWVGAKIPRTPAGVSWPPLPVPSQKVENYFLPKNIATSVFF